MRILVIAEHDGQNLKGSTAHTVGAAFAYQAFTPNASIDVLVLGSAVSFVAAQAQKLKGVDRVLVGDATPLAHGLAESCAPVIAGLAKESCAVFAPATTFGKNLLPRVAALLDEAQISDVVQILDARTFQRPIYAGNALETVTSACAIHCLTVRTTAFAPVGLDGNASLESLSPDALAQATQDLATFESLECAKKERPDLTEARVVVSGGRGLQNRENFVLLEELADLLHGAIGASRAAVDAGYAPNDYQVGQTGKIVAPDLYFAVGISGAIQHLAGMKDSKVIVAINKDPDAPIFQVADYGLVGDLFEAIPQLTQLIRT